MNAKGLLLAVAVLASWPVSAHAVEVGIEGGMSWTIHDFDCKEPYEYDTDTRKGVRFGIFTEHDLSPHFCIDGGAYYVTTGMKYDWMLYTVENRVNYLSMPAVLRARLAPPDEVRSGKNISPYVFAGPRIDVLLDMEIDPWFESIYEDFSRLGLGADIGVGMEILSARLEFRYGVTFTDSRPDEPLYKITTRCQSVSLKFLLPEKEASDEQVRMQGR